jgi:hypothetical protein
MSSNILFVKNKNKNGGGLFNFKIPFKGGDPKNTTTKKTTTKKKLSKKTTTKKKLSKKTTTKKTKSISSLITYGSGNSGFIGATECRDLDKHREQSLNTQ